MAAVVGFQSPYNDQRSVVALLADSPRGYELLNTAMNDSGKRAAMFGSVSVIRESGVNSLRVGDVYYVGHLPWFERLWYALSNHPVLLAIGRGQRGLAGMGAVASAAYHQPSSPQPG